MRHSQLSSFRISVLSRRSFQPHGECFQLLLVVASFLLQAQAPDIRHDPTINPDVLKTVISRVGIKQTTNGSTVHFSTNRAIKRCFSALPSSARGIVSYSALSFLSQVAIFLPCLAKYWKPSCHVLSS